MKDGLTELVFILDRSGSMRGLENDTIGGFNSMIEKQKAEEGEAFVTTVLFDDKYEMLHDHVLINSVGELTSREYYARGMTALLDAVGRTINSVGERLANTPEDERPEQVIFVITTDGFENASREFKKKQVREMIEHQQTKYSWTFMFLGANMDAVSEAESLGIDSSFAKTYTNSAACLDSLYSGVSNSISAMRAYNASSASFADEDSGLDETAVKANRMARAKAFASATLKSEVK